MYTAESSLTILTNSGYLVSLSKELTKLKPKTPTDKPVEAQILEARAKHRSMGTWYCSKHPVLETALNNLLDYIAKDRPLDYDGVDPIS